MQKKILIIDDYDDLSSALSKEFKKLGHSVKVTEEREDALDLMDDEKFDLIITDLNGEHLPPDDSDGDDESDCLPKSEYNEPLSDIKAFKLCFTNYRQENFSEDEVKNLVATTLNYKLKHVDRFEAIKNLHEKIEFEIPSVISIMHDVLEYLTKRVAKIGVVNPEKSNLFVALDEAFVNAVKHGNKFNTEKLVRISAEISKDEARFTIEDEGEGFDVKAIPDPCNPENLFKASGRGVFFIYNLMDEVSYNERGNRLTMVKRNENLREAEKRREENGKVQM